jgi:carboxymethylenebutenolidase
MKRIISIALWIVGVIVAVVLVLIASIAIDRGLGVGRLDALSNIDIPSGTNTTIQAYVARPNTDAEGPFPVVIMVHEWWGLNTDLIGKADALAQDGYIVIAPNVFSGSTASLMPTAFWQVSSTPTSQVDGDLDAVMLWLKNQSDADNDRIAIMGFCFGGGTAIRYSVNAPNIVATAVFYGTPISDVTQLKRLNGPVLGIFGGADKMIPQSDVDAFAEALTDAGIRHKISVYPDMPHAFVKGMEEIKQGGAQEKAWNQLREFLENSF